MGRLALRPGLRHYAHKAPEGESFTNTKACKFDGVNDYAYFVDGAGGDIGLPTSNGYSVSLWLKNSSWTTAQSTGVVAFALKKGPKWSWDNVLVWATAERGWTGAEWRYGLGVKERVNNTPDGDKLVSVTTEPADDTWVHYVFTSASTDSAAGANKLYLNGSEVASGTGASLTGSATAVVVGGLHYTTAYLNWDGWIDEPALYDRVLTSGEVSAIYAGGKAVNLKGLASSSALVNWWRMGDDSSDSNTSFVDQVGSKDLTGTGFGSGYGIVEDAPPA